MSSWLYFALGGYVIIALAAAIPLTNALSGKKNALLGILPAFTTAILSYAILAVGILLFGLWQALIVFAIAEIPPLVALSLYAYHRIKRYHTLLDAYKAQKKASRPAIVTTMKMRRALKGFSIPSPLDEEAQHEIVILLKNGTDPQTIMKFYNCRESDLRAIERAFDLHMAKNAPPAAGEDYTVLPDQREFLLRLMLTATPSSLSCGEGLLWNEKSIASLIHKASGRTPSRESVHRFLNDCGILLTDEHFAFSETPEAKIWERTQYEKIRMSALERGISIVWVYALHAKALPYTVLCATNPEVPTLYGVYKENSGLGDFLNKLGSGRLYAILCFKTTDFKKFTSPPQNIILFPYGERRDIPDT